MSEGWAYPLQGFMRERQYLQSLHYGQLLDIKKDFDSQTMTNSTDISTFGLFVDTNKADTHSFAPINQSVPIVLSIDLQQKEQLFTDEVLTSRVNLMYQKKLVAVLVDPQIYLHRKEERICRQFGHMDLSHPTTSQIRQSGDHLLGGELKVLV